MISQKIISQGAEATILLDKAKNQIIKQRIPKSYRIPELDEKIRKLRTRSETKLLTKASKVISCPAPEETKEQYQIIMPFIKGKRLSQHLDDFPLKQQLEICEKIGESVSKLHKEDLIHGDLTTSNMILKDNKIFFIDFGLGYQNGKYEDKAVDLHVLKQALEAKHFTNWEKLWKAIESSYLLINKSESLKVLERLKAVEKRGRYKEH